MKHLITIVLFLLCTNALFSQHTEYKVNISSINSKYAELGVIYLYDSRVIFASSKKHEDDEIFKKDRRRNNRQLFLELYHGIVGEERNITQAARFSNEMNNINY